VTSALLAPWFIVVEFLATINSILEQAYHIKAFLSQPWNTSK